VLVGSIDEPVAIAPLVRHGPVGQLEWLGARLGEPMDLRAADPAALGPLTDALARGGAPLSLRRVPAGSPTLDALRRSYQSRGLLTCRPAAGAPVVALDPAWAEPEKQFNSGRRSDFRRALRRASEHGEVTFEVLTPSRAELDGLLAEVFEVEAAGWKSAEGTALKLDPVIGQFFRNYCAAAVRDGTLRLCFMRIDGRAVATQLAVEHGDRFWLLKIGYDESLARCSPGTLLMLYTIGHAAGRGLAAYEFLGTAESWTTMWTSELRETVDVGAYPVRPRAGLALAINTADVALHRLARRVR
jgi:CelD/BcsL family acetyltransferase involved in cellulose biosynthesis